MKTIGYGTFASCSALEKVIIGESVQAIGDYAFFECTSLKCIYFYGGTSPTFETFSFYSVPATSVMTLSTYQGTTFGSLNVLRGGLNVGCPPWPTFTFTQSNTFSRSNTFTQSNTFSQSNTFTRSNTFSQSNSFTLSNTFTQSNTFTKSNTFSKSNTFTQSNTFSQSNTFTQSSTFSYTFTQSDTFTESYTFTQSNTFTESLRSGASFIKTLMLTHSLTLTQTISICNSTLSNSFIVSGSTYIQSNVVYYAYTAVVYSFYRSYYCSVFTVYYANEAASNDRKTTIITAACAAAAAIIVVAVLVVIFIKIVHRKHANFEQEAEDFEQNELESTNSLSGGISISHIEDDHLWMISKKISSLIMYNAWGKFKKNCCCNRNSAK